MAFDPANRLIAAIDAPGRAEAEALIARLGGVPGWIKLGLELFCAEGPAIVADHVARGHRVMLDLKLHDIPQTVARVTRGVRPAGGELGDPKRVMTARAARSAGADLVVVGRPLRDAPDRAAAARALVAELAAA